MDSAQTKPEVVELTDVICIHCRKKISENVDIEGLSIICPHCKKPM
ncbi:MAG: hypothetical protein KKF44_09015 [Nanoarchaeota archaeon]|nr:hypothetical protein [Nanoarchaeota archaeon]